MRQKMDKIDHYVTSVQMLAKQAAAAGPAKRKSCSILLFKDFLSIQQALGTSFFHQPF
jgi:hypothetical protein